MSIHMGFGRNVFSRKKSKFVVRWGPATKILSKQVMLPVYIVAKHRFECFSQRIYRTLLARTPFHMSRGFTVAE